MNTPASAVCMPKTRVGMDCYCLQDALMQVIYNIDMVQTWPLYPRFLHTCYIDNKACILLTEQHAETNFRQE